MKRPITKAHIRTEIEQQVDDFLNQGGAVLEVERGISGRDNPDGPIRPGIGSAFEQPKTGRTYIPEVVAAIDARRKPAAVKTKSARKSPRKKMIYDDFGEPLRWQWVEE